MPQKGRAAGVHPSWRAAPHPQMPHPTQAGQDRSKERKGIVGGKPGAGPGGFPGQADLTRTDRRVLILTALVLDDFDMLNVAILGEGGPQRLLLRGREVERVGSCSFDAAAHHRRPRPNTNAPLQPSHTR